MSDDGASDGFFRSIPEEAWVAGSPFMRAMHEAHAGSDRASIIVGCALLDEALRRAIESRVWHETATLNAVFESEGGAFATFEAKWQIAFLLGIFGKDSRDDLRALGSLRNKFAHRPEIDSFDHPELGSQILSLKLAKRTHRKNDIFGRANPERIKRDATKRERVIFVMDRLMYYFALDTFGDKQAPQAPRF
jgi:hypothetical protein